MLSSRYESCLKYRGITAYLVLRYRQLQEEERKMNIEVEGLCDGRSRKDRCEQQSVAEHVRRVRAVETNRREGGTEFVILHARN